MLCSFDVYPESREFERLSTAVPDGAFITVLGSCLDRLTRSVAGLGVPSEIRVTRSAGGLTSVRMSREFRVRTLLSGPAAGVKSAQRRASAAGLGNIITLDVGETSADVALLKDGDAV